MAIQLRGQRELFDRIKQLSRAVQDRVAVAVEDAAGSIKSRAEQKVPRDTGKLASAITTQLFRYQGGAFLTAQVKALPGYALAVEFGYKGKSGKGNRAHKMPIRKVGGKWEVLPDLAQWAQRKGKPAWAVARKLLKKGHPPQPFFFKSMDEEADRFLDRVKEILRDAPGSLGPPPNPASAGAGV